METVIVPRVGWVDQPQNITRETSTLLQSSSNVSNSTQGVNLQTTPSARKTKERSFCKWYYMYLKNNDLRKYTDVFSGNVPFVYYVDGERKERMLSFKVFPYTSADHKNRLEHCDYTKSEFERRKEAANNVREALDEEYSDNNKLRENIKVSSISGGGYLFIYGKRNDIEQVLDGFLPRKKLICDYKTEKPAVIDNQQMKEFLYIYESMPWDIELMQRPIEDYTSRKQNVIITGGVLKGKVGCIMRLHRNSKIVFAVGNMTIAISNFHAFPFKRIDSTSQS